MRDVLPAEAAHRRHLAETIYTTYAAFGYREIETPGAEDLRWLESSQGGENEKLIFKLLKRGLTDLDGLDLSALASEGLRFDLTVPLARFYATHGPSLPTPFRVFQLGPVWRAERPQRGRWRQFTQCDIDIIGEPTVLAETELITATCAALDAVGLNGYQVRINDRRLLNALLKVWGFDAEAAPGVLITIDKLDKIGLEGVTRALSEAGHASTAIDKLGQALSSAADAHEIGTFVALLSSLAGEMGKEPLEALNTIFTATDAGTGTLLPDLSLVRGMGYYTGPIFEIEATGLNASIGGGGRYDGMIGRFTKHGAPACGFSLGFERLVEVLPPADATSTQRIAVLYRPDQPLNQVMAEAARLRADRGTVVEVVPVTGRGKGIHKRLAAHGFTQVTDALSGQPSRSLGRGEDADA